MKAFLVTYSVAGCRGAKVVVLVDKKEDVESALKRKIILTYEDEMESLRLGRIQELSLDQVKVSDLSMSEFMRMTKELQVAAE